MVANIQYNVPPSKDLTYLVEPCSACPVFVVVVVTRLLLSFLSSDIQVTMIAKLVHCMSVL